MSLQLNVKWLVHIAGQAIAREGSMTTSMHHLNSEYLYPVGWGKVKHPGASYHKLQQAQLPLVSNTECSQKLSASPSGGILNVTKQMICAGNLNPNESQGGCHGDSGGPFVCKDSASGKFVLQGAVSWGSPNCNFAQVNKQYTVFARISKFRRWINLKISQNWTLKSHIWMEVTLW